MDRTLDVKGEATIGRLDFVSSGPTLDAYRTTRVVDGRGSGSWQTRRGGTVRVLLGTDITEGSRGSVVSPEALIWVCRGRPPV